MSISAADKFFVFLFSTSAVQPPSHHPIQGGIRPRPRPLFSNSVVCTVLGSNVGPRATIVTPLQFFLHRSFTFKRNAGRVISMDTHHYILAAFPLRYYNAKNNHNEKILLFGP